MCGSAVCNNNYVIKCTGGGGGGSSCCSLLTKSIVTNDRKERYLSLDYQQSGEMVDSTSVQTNLQRFY